jgi:hypothetical protein
MSLRLGHPFSEGTDFVHCGFMDNCTKHLTQAKSGIKKAFHVITGRAKWIWMTPAEPCNGVLKIAQTRSSIFWACILFFGYRQPCLSNEMLSRMIHLSPQSWSNSWQPTREMKQSMHYRERCKLWKSSSRRRKHAEMLHLLPKLSPASLPTRTSRMKPNL